MDINPPPSREGWKKPLPERTPRATYWPAALGLAITLILLGPVTMMPVSIVGLALAALALIGWIGEIVK